MSERFEIVVIGGGAVGASIQWHLAGAGRVDSVLIEKHELTAGSTWHAAGNVPTFSNSWLGQRAGNYAWRVYSELAADPDDPITYRHTRAFWPGHTPERIDHFHHLVAMATGLGFDLQIVTPAEMEAMHPYWHDDGTVIAGLLDPYEGDIDPSGLTQALARKSRSKGAQVRRHSRVVGIDLLDGADARWRVHVASKGETSPIDCDIVINAAGFYGAEISAMAGIDVPLAVLEHQYLVTGAVPELVENTDIFPLVRDPEIMFYLRRENDRLLFGNYGHAGRTVWEDSKPDVFDASLFAPDDEGIAEIAERAMAHVPMLGDVGIAEFVNGPITYTPDMNPLIGPAPGVEGFYQAVGVQIGITHAAAAGKVLTELITEGDTEWDVWPWDPRRYGSWARAGVGRDSYANTRVREMYEHQYGAPFPHRIWQSARPVQQTALYDTLAAKGARFGQIAGWERAFWFGADEYSHDALSYRDEHWHEAVAEECRAVRDHVGVMDHGGFTRYAISGPGAADYLDRVICTRLPSIGRVRLSYLLRPNGMVWSEATIGRFSEDEFLWLGPTAARERDYDWLYKHLLDDGSVQLSLSTDRASTLMVMGPRSRELLSRLTDADLTKAAAPWMSLREIEIAGVGVTALRVSFVGELGWELHVDDGDLVVLYEAIQNAGTDLGLRDFGSYALNAMRVEKGYHGWGSEFGVEYSPFDAGLDRFLDLDKPEFIGREAALAMSKHRPAWSYGVWTVDTASMPGPVGDPPPSAPIRVNGEVAGFVTSASMGFRTGKRVCLGYVEGRFADVTDGFTIDGFGADLPATRHGHGVYDPDHERPRS
ncbi:MAG: FAD-dependent oxidoreductase [Acidimicrobiia bacterium]|nr:FAD-dependent oxidoreductase [Acidimicrobiia bacterium]